MGIGSEHEVKELAGGSIETRVEIRTRNAMGSMSSGAKELSSGIGDDGGNSDKRGEGAIGVGRRDMSIGEDEEDEVCIGEGDGVGGEVDKEEVEEK